MGEYFVAGVELVSIVCGGCNTPFAMEKTLYQKRRSDHKDFYCPKGCVRFFTSESYEEKLKRQLAEQRQCCVAAQEDAQQAQSLAERERQRFNGLKGYIKKLKMKEAL